MGYMVDGIQSFGPVPLEVQTASREKLMKNLCRICLASMVFGQQERLTQNCFLSLGQQSLSNHHQFSCYVMLLAKWRYWEFVSQELVQFQRKCGRHAESNWMATYTSATPTPVTCIILGNAGHWAASLRKYMDVQDLEQLHVHNCHQNVTEQ